MAKYKIESFIRSWDIKFYSYDFRIKIRCEPINHGKSTKHIRDEGLWEKSQSFPLC